MPHTPSSPHERHTAMLPSLPDETAVSRSNDYSYAPYADAAATIVGPDPGLAEYWRMLSRRKGTLLLAALAGVLMAFLITRLQSPVYRARTLLEIENLNEGFLNIRNVRPTAGGGNFQSPEYGLRTQVTVLQSRPVLERALEKTELEKKLLASRRKGPVHAWATALRSRVTGSRIEEPQETVPPHELALTMAATGLKVRPEPNT